MTRRIKRGRGYQLTLEWESDDFVRTPRESQRTWVINRFLKEAGDDLDHLNQLATTFVTGVDAIGDLADRATRELDDHEIMEDWQCPVMAEMAKFVTATSGDVLEIGFGRGIGSTFIQQGKPRSHTIIECNESVIGRFHQWNADYGDRTIRLIPGLWQDVIDQLGQFDGIFFHTYPINEADVIDKVIKSATFAEHFFPVAAKHLRNGGVFTYLTNEIDSLSRSHQRALLKHFRTFDVSVLRNLDIPEDTSDAMWGDSMVMVSAKK